ncbi:hypothetical protein ACHAWF_006385 [Thalassiosira exigua]
MTNAVSSVIVASASAVAKVFVIGAIGYVSAKRPRPVPILPPSAMNAISKMNFDLLILPLIYSTLASAVTPEKMGSLWFVLVSGVGVICMSYATATVLGYLPFFRVENKTDFDALRVASAFPNIVALPILIFPTLCEFPVVHDAFYEGSDESTEAVKYRSCVDQSNAMIFIYFFAWNLTYWTIGYPTLVAAGEKRQKGGSLSTTAPHHASDSFQSEQSEVKAEDSDESKYEQRNTGHAVPDEEATSDENILVEHQPEQIQSSHGAREGITYILNLIANAIVQTIKSPGFIAMVLGFITACIPPLRDALFSPGGPLRFFGSAMESLGAASSSVGTLVVAASLVHQARDDLPSAVNDSISSSPEVPHSDQFDGGACDEEVSSNAEHTQHRPLDLRASMRKRRSSISRMSSRAIAEIRRRKPTIRMHSWFVASRLIVAPALVCFIIIAMDCGGLLDGIPNLAKMVVIVNAGLPGAQLIVLTLKSKGLSDSASIVAQVYLPSYLLSVVTIAGWTSLGLVISVPGEDGPAFCKR